MMSIRCIGKKGRCPAKVFRNFKIGAFRNLIKPTDFDKAAFATMGPGIRKRALTPEVVTWLIALVSLHKTSMAGSLLQAWETLRVTMSNLPKKIVSAQAWWKARKRVPVGFFRNIFEVVVGRFWRRFDSALRWKGLRLLAADGSCVNLPESPALRKAFGGPGNRKGVKSPVQGRIVAIVSVFTGACLDFVFGPYASAEMHMLKGILGAVGPEDLLLLDRGYYGYGLIWSVVLRGAQVLLRAQRPQGKRNPRRLKRLGRGDWLCEFQVTSAARHKWPGTPRTIILRMIRSHKRGFRPLYLLTTITDPEFASTAELVSLYWQRWRIETIYRELKHVLDIQNIRSQTEEGIYKEVVVQMLTYNLIRFLMQEAAQRYCDKGTSAVGLSFKNALLIVQIYAPYLLQAKGKVLKETYEQMLQSMAIYTVLQRPGRKYPRASNRKESARKRRRGRRANKSEAA